MNAWLAGINQVAAMGLAALLNTLWYAAAVVALTWVALRFSPRVNAATRYWIWTAVLGFLVILPFLPALVTQLETAEAAPAAAAPLATAPAVPQALQRLAPVTITLDSTPGSNHWPLYLLAIWMVIASWQLLRLLRGVISVKRLKSHAKVTQAAELPVQPRRKLQILASDEIRSPVAVGYIYPAVILPTELPVSLEEDEMHDVLLHELAHLVRYDDWLNLATRMLGAVLALHPLAAIVQRQIERDREMACDDFVVAHTGSAQSYARSLARLHDLRSTEGTRLLAPALLGRNVSLADRIESLLRRGREFSVRPSPVNLAVSAFLLALLLGAGGLIPGWFAIAQTKMNRLPSFETASIRPSKPTNHLSVGWHPGRFTASGITLAYLIQFAYSLKQDQIQGVPTWAKSRQYTIQAVWPPKANLSSQALKRLVREMLQSLLAERFKLRAHRATKQLPVYELVVAKGGSKMKPAVQVDSAGRHGHQSELRTGHIEGQMSVAQLVWWLSDVGGGGLAMLGRAVMDETGLSGRYEINLNWTPRKFGTGKAPGSSGFRRNEASVMPTGRFFGPSIFSALKEQLGLKLEAAKGPVQVLVVDHIEPPTPN